MPPKPYTLWIDANLPPKAAIWLQEMGWNTKHMYELGFLSADDHTIFKAARAEAEEVIILTKDEDFVNMVLAKKAPPKIIWITVGNISNIQLKELLISNIERAVSYIEGSDNYFVEIN